MFSRLRECCNLITVSSIQEVLGDCPYYSRWLATGRDNGEGEWKAGECLCHRHRRGAFCHLGKSHSDTLYCSAYIFPALKTFRLMFLRMRDICKIVNVQRKDKAFMVHILRAVR